VSTHQIVRAATEYEIPGDDLPGPTSGTRNFPAFDKGLARRSFGLHLALTLELLREFIIDLHQRYHDGVEEREIEAINLALQLMQSEGMIEGGTRVEFKA